MTRRNHWVVLKVGGTSVADPRNWEMICDAIRSVNEEGDRPLLVCSALSGISDALEALLRDRARGNPVDRHLSRFAERHEEFAERLGLKATDLIEEQARRIAQRLGGGAGGEGEIPAPTSAEVMASGELLLTAIATRWLAANGFDPEWRDARRLLVVDPPPDGADEKQAYLSAVGSPDPDPDLADALGKTTAEVVVTQGFIARNPEGRTVLLGRGGSDIAAALFAARIGAKRLEIWTDVPGIFTANPRLIPGARLLERLSFNEAEALAGLGARVLHPRSVDPVRQAGVPLLIRWAARPDLPGTEITEDGGDAGRGVKAVASRDHVCLISMIRPVEWQPIGFMADVAGCFRDQALSMDLVSSSASRIQSTLDLGVASGTRARIPDLLDDLGKVCTPEVRHDVATVSLVGRGIRNTLHDFAPKLGILEERDVLMVSPTANDLSITFVVPRRQEAGLVRRLHRVLFTDDVLDDHFGPTYAELLASEPVAGTAVRE